MLKFEISVGVNTITQKKSSKLLGVQIDDSETWEITCVINCVNVFFQMTQFIHINYSASMKMNMYSVLIYKSNACNLREYIITYLLQ